MADQTQDIRQRLADVLALLEQRSAPSLEPAGKQPLLTYAASPKVTASPAASEAVALAYAKVSEAIAILQREQVSDVHTVSLENVAPEPFRTTLQVKDGGQLIAERIPILQSTATGDALTRIRGIDTTLARRLTAIGVTRFAQIAAWRTEDVRGVASALGLGRSISQQNWIEQAQLLHGAMPEIQAETAVARESRLDDAPDTQPAAISPAVAPARPRHHPAGVKLDDILATIRRGSTSLQTAERIADAQQRRQPPPVVVAAGTLLEASAPADVKSPAIATPPKDTILLPALAPHLPIAGMSLGMPGVAMPVAEESRPKAVPVHVQATQRLERLEAEITTLGARVSAPATARIVVPVVERRSLPTAQRGADALVRGLTRVPPPLAGEADVEIIIRQPRRSSGATDLGPAPSTAGISQPVAAATTAPAVSLPAVIAADDLEEASVVIVKRPTNRALVADAFQTVTKPAPATTGVKRFLRAFSRG